ncbi:MAG: hypothetical protein LBM94_02370 [Propionibacteriaceae bacterium]|jgi:hypothetical protein|nr:hypothetical protein [Propionibacteriaceae bacterium]
MVRKCLVLACALVALVVLPGCTPDDAGPADGTASVTQTQDESPSASATPTGDPNLVSTDPNTLVVSQCIHDVVFLKAPVTTVDAAACSYPHDGEVVGATQEGSIRDSEFAKTFCTAAFNSYIGIDFNASALDLMFIKPGADVSNGQLVCLAYDSRANWTTSMQGAAE